MIQPDGSRRMAEHGGNDALVRPARPPGLTDVAPAVHRCAITLQCDLHADELDLIGSGVLEVRVGVREHFADGGQVERLVAVHELLQHVRIAAVSCAGVGPAGSLAVCRCCGLPAAPVVALGGAAAATLVVAGGRDVVAATAWHR